MTNAKKFLITTESHELFIVRRRAFPLPQRICTVCSTSGCGMTLDDAGTYTGLSAMELIRGIGTAAIHAFEAPGGQPFICRKSLENFCNGEK